MNPATAGSKSDYEFALGNQRMFGAIASVSSSYFIANMRIQHGRPDKPFSSAGVLLYNDSEGKYLNRTRFYASYSWHGNVSQKVKFSAGLLLGGMNYSVKGTALSGNGSDTKADGAAGISFYSDNFHVGISVEQLFNSKVQPLQEITVLSPRANISASKTFFPDEDYRLITSFASAMMFPDGSDSTMNTLTDINILLELKKYLMISAGLHNNTMLVVAAGVNRIQISEGQLGLIISYTFPMLQKALIKTKLGEIGIYYFF